MNMQTPVLSPLAGSALRDELVLMIEKFGTEKSPLSVTEMVNELGGRVSGRDLVTGQLSWAKKKHKHLHWELVPTGRFNARGHKVSEDGFWIDPKKLNQKFGAERLTEPGKPKMGTPLPHEGPQRRKLSADEMRQKAKAARIKNVLKDRLDPMRPITYFDISLILGIGESAVRNHGTAASRWEPHVWRKRKEGKGGEMLLWYDESAVNPEYGSKPREKAAPQTNLVQPDDVPWKPKAFGPGFPHPNEPAQPVHHTIATRDYLTETVPIISEEMYKTAIRTVNLFVLQNEWAAVTVVDGKLTPKRLRTVVQTVEEDYEL